MWKCSHCGETVEVNFEECWNCGTSKEGIVDPEFLAVEQEIENRDERDGVVECELKPNSNSFVLYAFISLVVQWVLFCWGGAILYFKALPNSMRFGLFELFSIAGFYLSGLVGLQVLLFATISLIFDSRQAKVLSGLFAILAMLGIIELLREIFH